MKYIYLYLTILINSISSIASAQQWSVVGTGDYSLNANDNILTITTDMNGNIYAAGKFSYQDSGFNCVTKWDGSKWTLLGSFNELEANDSILTITTDKRGYVYAAGKFKDKNGEYYVAKWNGNIWSKLGSLQANGQINKIITDQNNNLYAGGQFKNDSDYCYIAKWNDTVWTELGNANGVFRPTTDFINDIMISNNNIYRASEKVYKWNGSTWSMIGDFRNYIHTITADLQGNIYAAGGFVDNNNMKYVAKLEGNSWVSLGKDNNALNTSGLILSILSDAQNNIYASGWYMKDGTGNAYVAVWDGIRWNTLGANSYNKITYNTLNYINAMTFDKYGNLFAAGNFTDSSGRNFVARYGFPLGTNNPHLNNKFEVYPNPSQNHLYINLHSDKDDLFSIVNACGQTVYQSIWNPSIETKELDISSFSRGVYILKIGQNIKKFIID